VEILFLLLVVLVGGFFWTVKLYNQLRSRSEAVKRSQSNLVGELKKRATLANQLIEICKGYGDHEKLAHITVAGQNQGVADPNIMAAATSRALAGVSFVAERFPELKANQTYNTLMGQIQTIENDLQNKREAMNTEVEKYNGFRSSFPAVLIAEKLGFPEARYFSTDEDGLDANGVFQTDDGELLRAQFARLGKGMGDATRQLSSVAGTAINKAQASLAKPDRVSEDETISEQVSHADDASPPANSQEKTDQS
jgi:LemA protein